MEEQKVTTTTYRKTNTQSRIQQYAMYSTYTSKFVFIRNIYTAPDDYININEGLIFSSGLNITMCVQITVLFDGIAEDTELFSVVLSTNDSSVIFTRGTTLVAIFNSDGKEAIM